uniref:Secretory calcium-binding phosphoprotein 6 n=1 Tax=Danio rerio TaxID=7955 RepID=B9UIU3_DANRE|nr:ameloblastin precursor [Danio rerio]ACF33440.1 secretory calcium-binding phosphoprotein 6 [Danio rerio]|eukprot:NP_001138709.1 ameloblastin precursor [Danio rerio]
MRLIVMIVCFLAGTSAVPISLNADLKESLSVGDMQQFQPGSPRMLSGLHQQVPNPWASQPNPSTAVRQHPAQFQYLPYSQQPQFFYYPILGQQSRNPTFSYGVSAFQHAASQQYPANAAPALRPARPQQGQNAHQMRQPQQQQQQQQFQPIFYMVPQMPQRMAGSYGGLSSEELQNMGRVNMHLPAIRGNVFPVSGPQTVVPIGPVRPPNPFPATGMTYPGITELQQPSIIAVPPSRDAIPATGGSHPNSAVLPSRISGTQDRDRAPCVSAEIPLTNSFAPLDSGHGAFISADVPTVHPDPQSSGPNLVPDPLPTAEYKEDLFPAAPPLLSDTVDTNTANEMYP